MCLTIRLWLERFLKMEEHIKFDCIANILGFLLEVMQNTRVSMSWKGRTYDATRRPPLHSLLGP